jgi:ABC-type uncharacterized transport system permease subunit
MMLIDFLIGMFLANALPHYLFGRLRVGVLGLFGYSPRGNLLYGLLCISVATALFGWKYGFSLESLKQHMMLMGTAFVVLSYLLGWDVVNRFLRNDVVSS